MFQVPKRKQIECHYSNKKRQNRKKCGIYNREIKGDMSKKNQNKNQNNHELKNEMVKIFVLK